MGKRIVLALVSILAVTGCSAGNAASQGGAAPTATPYDEDVITDAWFFPMGTPPDRVRVRFRLSLHGDILKGESFQLTFLEERSMPLTSLFCGELEEACRADTPYTISASPEHGTHIGYLLERRRADWKPGQGRQPQIVLDETKVFDHDATVQLKYRYR